MHVQRPTRTRGFTLIEIMIVVVIIGVLSVMAYPMYAKYQCRAKQGEAKVALKVIYLAQDAYRGRNDMYITAAMAPTELYPVLTGNYSRYDFPIINATNNTFLAEANGKAGNVMVGDSWSVNHLFDITNTTPTFCE